MELKIGDKIEMKKPHPCGCKTFTLLRMGMDFKIRCEGCSREIMAPRKKIEKNITKRIISTASEDGDRKLNSEGETMSP